MVPPPAPPDAEVRALAGAILKRTEFAVWHDVPWLLSALAWLSGLWRTDPVLYWALLVGLVALAAILLTHAAWAVRRALAVPAPRAPSRPGSAASPPFLEEADVLAERGKFLEAARRVQLAALDLLLRARVVELGRSDPNRTLRRRLHDAALPEAERHDLLALIDRLERRWFRDRHEDRELYDRWRRLHVRLGAVLKLA
jgi:HEPN domain-containing protein